MRKTKSFSLSSLLAMLIFASSCNRPACKNTNPTFEKFSLDSREYKSELAKQMQNIGTENLSYWFDRPLKKDGKEFLLIHIQGGELCAKGEIQVRDWDNKIIGMRRKGGGGYSGAELSGLKIEIEQDSTGTNFIYKDVEMVID